MTTTTTNKQLPFYHPLDPTHQRLWPDFTLVMPLCAVGNIGQLSCDLIISTLLFKHECQLIGRLYSPALMPVVGPNAYSIEGPLTTSTEVYESKKHKLIIIQQRTSYYKALKDIYTNELVNWIKESKFDKVYILTSSFAQCNPTLSMSDNEMVTTVGNNSIGCITTSSFEKEDPNWKSLDLKQIPDKRTIKVIQDGLSFLPGSGLTKPLIKAFEKAFIPAAFLIDFCSEGMNKQDCYQVVNIINKLIKLGCESTSKINSGDEPIMETGVWIEPYFWSQLSC